MTIRYIVRPKGIKLTADALKLETGAQAVVLTDELVNTKFNPKLDLLIGLPRAARLEGLTEGQLASYHQLRGFYTSSKFAQRKAMHEGGVNIPSTLFINQHEPIIGKKYVVRPMSHRTTQPSCSPVRMSFVYCTATASDWAPSPSACLRV
jgi:hypothetical protein